MDSSQYSAILNNEAVLTNATHFMTGQRAFVAKLIPINDILEKLPQQELDFLALQAFSEFMTATEDLIGGFQCYGNGIPPRNILSSNFWTACG
jgi:hypothetical protein